MKQLLKEMKVSPKLENKDLEHLIEFHRYFLGRLWSKEGETWTKLTFEFLMREFSKLDSRNLLFEVFPKVLE